METRTGGERDGKPDGERREEVGCALPCASIGESKTFLVCVRTHASTRLRGREQGGAGRKREDREYRDEEAREREADEGGGGGGER